MGSVETVTVLFTDLVGRKSRFAAGRMSKWPIGGSP
jgi:hypothetical protein